MPFDISGKKLKIGDEVILRCIVTKIFEKDQVFNCAVNTFYPVPPFTETTHLSNINSKQLELVED